MPSERIETVDSPCGSYAGPWLAMWECAAIWGRASLEAIARMSGQTSPRNDALATWSLAMDRQLRTPSFLRLMQYGLQGLQVASARSWIDLAFPFLGFRARY
jgi:hypothetical protein